MNSKNQLKVVFVLISIASLESVPTCWIAPPPGLTGSLTPPPGLTGSLTPPPGLELERPPGRWQVSLHKALELGYGAMEVPPQGHQIGVSSKGIDPELENALPILEQVMQEKNLVPFKSLDEVQKVLQEPGFNKYLLCEILPGEFVGYRANAFGMIDFVFRDDQEASLIKDPVTGGFLPFLDEDPLPEAPEKKKGTDTEEHKAPEVKQEVDYKTLQKYVREMDLRPPIVGPDGNFIFTGITDPHGFRKGPPSWSTQTQEEVKMLILQVITYFNVQLFAGSPEFIKEMISKFERQLQESTPKLQMMLLDVPGLGEIKVAFQDVNAKSERKKGGFELMIPMISPSGNLFKRRTELLGTDGANAGKHILHIDGMLRNSEESGGLGDRIEGFRKEIKLAREPAPKPFNRPLENSRPVRFATQPRDAERLYRKFLKGQISELDEGLREYCKLHPNTLALSPDFPDSNVLEWTSRWGERFLMIFNGLNGAMKIDDRNVREAQIYMNKDTRTGLTRLKGFLGELFGPGNYRLLPGENKICETWLVERLETLAIDGKIELTVIPIKP